MAFKKSLLLAAASASVAMAAGKVNVYFGQAGSDDLGDVCETGVDYVTLSFVNISPENGGTSGYAGDNFANHCYAGYYSNSELLKDCPKITDGFARCRAVGTKILLSIGGVFSASSNYTVSTAANGKAFGEFLAGAFGPYDSTSDYPRPFDVGDTHNYVDGFDFDIEEKFADASPWLSVVSSIRSAMPTSLITGAPQCPYSDSNFQMGYLLANVAFDALFVQFYNNPVCDAVSGGFNYDSWLTYLASTPNDATPLFIGLSGSSSASGSGYVAPSDFEDLIATYSSHANFGGVSLWDEYYAQQNEVTTCTGDINYLDLAIQVVKGDAPELSSCPSSTSSTSSSTSSSTTSSSTAVAATSTSASAPASSTSASSTSASSTSASAAASASVSASVASSTTAAASSTAAASASAVFANSTTSAPASVSTGASLTTSTVRTTVTSTILSCAPTVTDCPYGKVTTKVIDLYTTVCPVTAEASLTTSTVRTTVTSTILSCAPTVTDCPYGKVTTKVIDLYTTVCPVAEATPTAAVSETVSTIYSTTYYTITSCAATVTDCPARLTSKVVPVATVTVAVYPSGVAVGAVAAPKSTLATVPVALATGSLSTGSASNGSYYASPTQTPFTAGAAGLPSLSSMSLAVMAVLAVALLM